MNRIGSILLLACGFAPFAYATEVERYIVILKQYSGPSPDLARLGGTIEFRQQEELVVVLPAGAVDALRQDPIVKYVQRVGASAEAPLMGTPVEPSPERGRLRPSGTALQPRPEGASTWDSGVYTYDGAGNISAIGTETYVYDKVQRLVNSTINAVTDTYAYDDYGNVTAKSVAGAPQSYPSVDTTTNRFNATGYTYDAAGNLTSDGSWTFSYDALSQPLSKTYGGTSTNQAYYIYTAGDERIGVQENERIGVQENGWWIWSLRDEGGKVLRQYRSSASNPAMDALWLEDFVWRDGLLLGSERPLEMGGRRHFHLDHLGTPRLITSENALQVSSHDYYPFGDERSTIPQETAGGFDREDPMKFTGHERDFAGGQGREDSHYVDYMHARYFSPVEGRFLSVDPIVDEERSLANPQGWNRYAYALNNPLRYTDPTGMMWFKMEGVWKYLDGVDQISQWNEKTASLTVTAGTKQFLAFDGGTLTLYGANGKVTAFPAVSGVPGADGRSQPGTQNQLNRGPAVEGRYNIFPASGIQHWSDLTTLQKVESFADRGPWPGWPGRGAWGTARAQMYPDAATRAQIKAMGRTGSFFIHGGWRPGSAGCIDLCRNDEALFGLIDKTTNEAVPVFIEYKP